jgi:hypothetical protein
MMHLLTCPRLAAAHTPHAPLSMQPAAVRMPPRAHAVGTALGAVAAMSALRFFTLLLLVCVARAGAEAEPHAQLVRCAAACARVKRHSIWLVRIA